MLPASIVIRTYENSDYTGCLDVFLSNVPTYFAESERAEFEDFLTTLSEPYFVVEQHGSVLGCGGYYVTEDSIGRLTWGMVRRDCQRMSIGTSLLVARIQALFSDERVTEIGIDTSQVVAPFFQRFGFVVFYETQNGLGAGLDLVKMRLCRDHWKA